MHHLYASDKSHTFAVARTFSPLSLVWWLLCYIATTSQSIGVMQTLLMLCNQPLPQSVYTETIRPRTAVYIIRDPKLQDAPVGTIHASQRQDDGDLQPYGTHGEADLQHRIP